MNGISYLSYCWGAVWLTVMLEIVGGVQADRKEGHQEPRGAYISDETMDRITRQRAQGSRQPGPPRARCCSRGVSLSYERNYFSSCFWILSYSWPFVAQGTGKQENTPPGSTHATQRIAKKKEKNTTSAVAARRKEGAAATAAAASGSSRALPPRAD